MYMCMYDCMIVRVSSGGHEAACTHCPHSLPQHKWMCLVKAKNEEIEQFRQELDTILSTLHVLQAPLPPNSH